MPAPTAVAGAPRRGHQPHRLAQLDGLDVRERLAEHPRRDVAEALDIARRELDVGRRRPGPRLGRARVAGRARVGGRAAGRPRGLEPVHRQQLGKRGRRRRRGVHDRDAVPDGRRDDRPEQRVVRAAEQQRVDLGRRRAREHELPCPVALAEQRRQVLGDRGLHLRAREDPGLDHRHEARRRVLVHLDRRVLVLDRVEVGMRADRRRGRDHAHPPVARRERRGRGARPDDAEHRQVVARPQVPQGDRGRGVARDDERLDVARRELVERLHGERPDLLVGADAVRGARVVTEVDRRFVR